MLMRILGAIIACLIWGIGSGVSKQKERSLGLARKQVYLFIVIWG